MTDSFLPPLVMELMADAKQFHAELAGASGEVSAFEAKSRASFGRFAAAGKAAMLGIGGAAIATGVVALKLGTDFQSSMELIRTQAGASQAEVDKMSRAVLGLAGPTATAPEELAKGLYHLESSGLRGAKALEALKVAAEGAKVGGADLESVTNALNAVIASGISGAQDMSQAMGALNATVGSGDMRMQDLAEALGTGVLATVKGFGVSLNDVSAALAVFGDNNIRGADAATQLRMAVLFMAKPAASAKDALAKIGLTTKSLADDMQHGGLNRALTDLHDHLVSAGYTGNKTGQILVDAFGHKAGTGLSVLVGQFGRFQSKVEEVHKGAAGFGDSWAATTKTFRFELERVKTSVEALATRLGLWLIPKVQLLGSVTADAVKWLREHKDVALILAGAIGGPLVAAVGAFTVSMVAAAGATLLAAAPFLAIGAAIGAATAGVIYAWQHWSAFRNAVRDVGVAITGVGRDVQAGFGVVAQGVGAFVGWVRGIIGNFGAFWQSHGQQITEIARVTWGLVKQIVTTEVTLVMDVIRPWARSIKDLFTATWHAASTIVVTTWRVIGDVIRTEVKVALDAIGIVLDLVTGKWGKAWADAKKLVSDAFHGITAVIGDFANGAATLLVNAGRDLITGLIHGIEGAVGGVKNVLGDLTHKITSWKGPADKDRHLLTPAGRLLMMGLIDGITSMSDALRKSLQTVTSDAHSITLKGAKGIAEALVKGLAAAEAPIKKQLDTLKSQLDAVKQAAQQLRSSIGGQLLGQAALANMPNRTSTSSAVDGRGNTVTTSSDLGQDISVGGITGYETSTLAALTQFKGDLTKLGSKGLSDDLLQQIAAMGTEKGDQYAQALLGATSGQIKALDQIQASIASTSDGIGKFLSDRQYGKSIDSLEHSTTALNSVIKSLDKTIRDLKHSKGGDVVVNVNGASGWGLTPAQLAYEIRLELIRLGKRNGNTTLKSM